MKKVFYLGLALLLMAGSIVAQDQPKKKGGFWNKVKKGVESTTGLDVSKETLFVYPTIGEWKMQFVSAIGDPDTGVVTVKIKIMPLANQGSAFLKLTEVLDEKKNVLPEGKFWKATSKFNTHDLSESPLYNDLTSNTYSQYTFQPIAVPAGSKFIGALKFTLEAQNSQLKGFEVRDIPVEWVKTE